MKHAPLSKAESSVAAFSAEAVRSADSPADDVHIAGILVHARRDLLEQVRCAIAELSGTVVHGAHADGKLVVTTEGASSRALVDAMNVISAIPGVISAALIYQHNESLHAMQQEMP